MKIVSRWMYFAALVLCMLLLPLSAGADVALPSDLTVIEEDAFLNNTALTGTLVIPEGVTAIGDRAFSGCTGLTTVVLPESVTEIGAQAFSGCTGLTGEIVIGADVTVAEDAFEGCGDLTVTVKKAETSAEYFTYTIANEEVTITGFDAASGVTDVVVPAKIEGYPVTAIGSYSFRNFEALTSISIPEGVTTIGDYAFYGCSGLTSVTLSEGVTTIGDYAFYGCSSLTSADLPESVTTIGSAAFMACSGLTSIDLPDNVATIEGSAFWGCSSLTSISIPEGVTTIDGLFGGCSDLTSVVLPESVTTIGSSAFAYCSSLNSINIPESVTAIGNYAFNNCSSLTSIALPEGVTIIDHGTFFRCSSLSSINIPEGVTTIGDDAFYYCNSLTGIELPEGLKMIGADAFAFCYEAELTLPEGLTGIKSEAFHACSLIEPIMLSDDCAVAPDAFDDGVTVTGGRAPVVMDCLSYKVVENSAIITKFDTGYCLTTVEIPEKIDGLPVTGIDDFAFDYSNDLTSVTIPDGMSSIGSHAFWSCISLTSVTIPNSVETIGDDAFGACPDTLVIYGEAGSYAETYATENEITFVAVTKETPAEYFSYTILNDTVKITGFDQTSGVTEIIIPAKIEGYPVTTINVSAFRDFEALTSVVIPDSVISIGGSAFQGCGNLASIDMSENVTDIGAFAFFCCDSLTSFSFPAGVTVVNDYVFDNCSSLISVALPAGVKSIGDNAFAGCTSLKDIELPADLISIGESAFSSCVSLTNIELPDGLKTIDVYGFAYCSGLTEIVIPESVVAIKSKAFSMCTNLSGSIELTDDCIVAADAFEICDKLSVTGGRDATLADCLSYEIVESNVIITAFDNGYCMTDVEIPEQIDGLPVTSIDDYCFYHCTHLITVTLPNGVCDIGSSAFRSCTNLTTVTIPSSVETIGDNVFDYCAETFAIYGEAGSYAETYAAENEITFVAVIKETPAEYFTYTIANEEVTITGFDAASGVTDVVVPAKIEGYPVTALAEKVFYNNDSVTSVVIPDGVSSVGDSMFYDCAKLQSVTLPANLTSINNYLLSYCDKLESVNVPDGVTSIGDMAFYDCRALTSITIPAAVTEIASSAFNRRMTFYGDAGSYAQTYAANKGYIDFVAINCFSYTVSGGGVTITAFNPASGITDVVIPPKMANLPVKGIGANAFKDCTAVTSVTLPASVTSVGSSAFSGCTGLTDFSLPGTVTSIGSNAFSGCTGLTGIAVPASVTAIGADAFEGCSDSLVIYGKTGSYVETYAKENGITFSCETSPAYFSYTIADGEVTITGFSGENDLTEIVIPAKIEGYPVTTIGWEAFCGSKLISVTLPEGVKTLKLYAFARCESLSYVKIPDSMVDMNNVPFQNSPALSTLDISADHPTYAITDGMVYNKNTKTLEFCLDGRGTVSTVVNVPEGIEVIGSCALRYLDWMTEVTLPSTLKRIENIAFGFDDGTCGVTSLTIPDSVEYIGYWAFGNWSNLTTLTISPDIAYVDECAFTGATSLTGTLNFSSKACIHATAFAGCENLTINVETVEGEAPATHFEYEAADGAVTITSYRQPLGVTSVTVPAKIDGLPVTKIGDEAFNNCTALTEIVIPESVTTIGEVAFSYCTALTEIVIPEGVTEIGDFAFNGCSALTSITLPSTLKTVGCAIVSKCTALTTFNLAEGCMLGYQNGMLYTTEDMKLNTALIAADAVYFEVPGFIRIIGSYSIYSQSLYTLEFAEGITTIEAYAISGSNNVYRLIMPSTMMTIKANAFRYMSGLYGPVMLPYGAQVDSTAFEGTRVTLSYAPAPEEDTPAEYFTYETNDTGITITNYSGPAVITSVRFPATIDGQAVTAIGGSFMFSPPSTVKTVYVPEGVTELGAESLRESRSLENIYLPSTLTSIGDNCFVWCDNLKSITIPDSVTTMGADVFSSCEKLTYCKLPSGLKTLPTWTFGNCSALEEVVMPTALEEIETWAFYNCGPIESLVIPDTVTKLAEQAFYMCGAKSITLSKGLTELPKQAMQYCNGLTSLVIPEGVTTLGEEALSTCTALESLSLPSTLTTIGTNALGGCSSLTSVTIDEENEYFKISNGALLDAKTGELLILLTGIAEDGSYTVGSDVKSIGSQAFSGQGALTSVVIPEGVTSIGSQAFGNCVKLTSVTIPASVTEIAEGAFMCCDALTSITIAEDNENYSITDNALISADKTLILPIGAKTGTSFTVPEGVVRIGDYAFSWAQELTTVSLPSTLTSIGDYAFNRCFKLTNVVLPDGLTSIGVHAFDNNLALTEIALPDMLTSLGEYAFWACRNLSSVKLSAQLTSIPTEAFEFCGLTEVTLPDSVRTLGTYCFGSCDKLTKVTLNDGLTTIGFGSFGYCSSLTEIYIPESVTTIDVNAFVRTWENLTVTVHPGSAAEEYCKAYGVEYVYTPDAWTDASHFTYEVVDSAYVTITGYDDAEATVIMPETIDDLPVKAIADNAFANSTITGIVFPAGLESIGDYAFSGCTALVDCTLPDNLLTIGDYAFKDCTAIKNGILHIPGSVTTIGETFVDKSIILSVVIGTYGETYATENGYAHGC